MFAKHVFHVLIFKPKKRRPSGHHNHLAPYVIKPLSTAEQAVSLKSYLDDESAADDIDSGVGEAFEEAFAKVYPDSDGVGIGSTSAKVKIVKK